MLLPAYPTGFSTHAPPSRGGDRLVQSADAIRLVPVYAGMCWPEKAVNDRTVGGHLPPVPSTGLDVILDHNNIKGELL
jgi:hypothetical protein